MTILRWGMLSIIGLSAPALALMPCNDREVMDSNLFILTSTLPVQGRVSAFTATETGTDSAGHSTLRYHLNPCGGLLAVDSEFYRDYGTAQMTASASAKSGNNRLQGAESMEVTVRGVRLTHGRSEISYKIDAQGRIVRRLEQFEIDGNPGQSETAYRFDSQSRLIYAHTTSTHAFFDETSEFSYDAAGRLVRVSSAKGSLQLTWDEAGRWLRSEREVNHPESVQITVSVCGKWDEHNNCLQGVSSETEKYAHQSLQTHYAFTHDIQYK